MSGTDNVMVTHEAELGSDLLSVVARLNRLASQRTRLPLPWAQARLTEKGRKTLEQARADRAAAINPRLERLDAADRETLAAAVEVFRKLLADAAEHPLS